MSQPPKTPASGFLRGVVDYKAQVGAFRDAPTGGNMPRMSGYNDDILLT